MTNDKIAELVKNTTPFDEINFVVTAPLSKRVQDDFLENLSKCDFAPKEKGSFIRTEEDIPMGTIIQHNEIGEECPIVMPIIVPDKARSKGNAAKKTAMEVVMVDEITKNIEEVVELPERINVDDVNISNLRIGISKCSNAIRAYMMNNELYAKVSEHILDKKLLAETFYQKVQNCIYHTLRDFCGITVGEQGDILPTVSEDLICLPTLRFLDKFINNKAVVHPNDRTLNGVRDNYRKEYSDGDGIQIIWLDLLKKRIGDKFHGAKNATQICEEGIEVICDFIKEEWCAEEVATAKVIEAQSMQDFIEDPSDESEDYGEDQELVDLFHGRLNTRPHTMCEDDDFDALMKAKELYEASEDEESEEDETDADPITVTNDQYDIGMDVITITGSDAQAYREIPFYLNWDEFLAEKIPDNPPSIVDDRNGIWDWLIHIPSPEFMFNTLDPDRYLKGNSYLKYSNIKHVIMDVNDNVYTIGVYNIDADLGRVEEGDEGLAKHVNHLVQEQVAGTMLSFLPVALKMKSLFTTEEFVLSNMEIYGDWEDDSEYEEDESFEKEESVDLVDAAVASLAHSVIDEIKEPLTAGEDPIVEQYGEEAADDNFVYKVRHKKRNVDY